MVASGCKGSSNAAEWLPLAANKNEFTREIGGICSAFPRLPRATDSMFCRLHDARNRDSFSQALYFVEGMLANTIIDGFRKSKVLERYMSDPNLPKIDIDLKNIVLEEIQNPPYNAKVDLQKVYLSRVDRGEIKREFSTRFSRFPSNRRSKTT
jgi:hypothetical protein